MCLEATSGSGQLRALASVRFVEDKRAELACPEREGLPVRSGAIPALEFCDLTAP
jgi:hypothetical protein